MSSKLSSFLMLALWAGERVDPFLECLVRQSWAAYFVFWLGRLFFLALCWLARVVQDTLLLVGVTDGLALGLLSLLVSSSRWGCAISSAVGRYIQSFINKPWLREGARLSFPLCILRCVGRVVGDVVGSVLGSCLNDGIYGYRIRWEKKVPMVIFSLHITW